MKLRVMILGFAVSIGVTKAATHTVSLAASGSPWNPTIPGSFAKAVADAANTGDTIIFDFTTLGNSPTINLDAAFANFDVGGFVIDGLRGKPTNSDKVKIQGTSGQWNGLLNLGNNGTTLIGLDFQPAAGNGIYIKSSGNVIDSCLVHGMAYNGIQLDAGANGNTIKNSLIYDNLTSNPTTIDYAGIYSLGGGLTIDSCFIYSNNANGIIFYNNTSDGSSITNSTIGRDESGNELGNDFNGIFAWGASNVTTHNCVVVNNGFEPQNSPDRISGIRYQAINGSASITSGVISSNYVGTDENKTNAGNEFDGVTIHTNVSNIQVFDNVIAYNGFGGSGNGGGLAVRINSTDIEITANFIGCHLDSTDAGNNEYGISMESGSGHTIGGSDASDANIIGYSSLSNKGKGVWISFAGTACEVYNNLILGNAKAGVEIQANASNSIIGADGQGNTITGNGTGIIVSGSGTYNNTLRYNSFSCNSNSGISLVSSGNDNYGNVASPKGIVVNSSELRADFISGFAPSAGATIDIYVADNVCAANCEASNYQGMTMVATVTSASTASSNGLYMWEYDFVAGGNLVNKSNAVVLATENGTAGQVNTSEFSVCAVLCNIPTDASVSVDDADLCIGETATFTADANGMADGEDYSYTWYRTEINPDSIVGYEINDESFSIDVAGDYMVLIASQLDSAACSDTSGGQTITVNELPVVTLPEDDTICFLLGEQVDITATVDTSAPGNLIWSTGDEDVITITVSDTTTYTATYTDQFDCSASDVMRVFNQCTPPDPEGPNIVTENSPWTPIGEITNEQFVSSDLVIYNRWGTKMFASTEVLPEWTGQRNNGNQCAAGVYYWIWSYKDINGGEFTYNGFVQLLRQ